MSNKRVFPPRRAYSLKEATEELGCTLEALIDWAHQGFIKICLKVTSNTRMFIPEWRKATYARYIKNYHTFHGIELDISNCNVAVGVETSQFQWSDNYVGQTYISLHNHWIDTIADQTRRKIQVEFEEEADGVLKKETAEDFEFDIDKRISVIDIPGIIRGFWVMQAGNFYDFKLGADNEFDEALRAYGGDALAISRLVISADELFLMKEEFDFLHGYKEGNNHVQNNSETINDYGVHKSWKEQLKPIADIYYEENPKISQTELASKLFVDAGARNIRTSNEDIPAKDTIRKEFARSVHPGGKRNAEAEQGAPGTGEFRVLCRSGQGCITETGATGVADGERG